MVTLERVNSSVAATARMMRLQDSQCTQFASDALEKEELVKRRNVVSVKTTVKLCAWRRSQSNNSRSEDAETHTTREEGWSRSSREGGRPTDN